MKLDIHTRLSPLILLAILTSFSVQAQKGRLTAVEKENLKAAKVMIVRYEAPPLYIMTPQDAVGEGLIADLTKSDDAKAQGKHRFYPNMLVQKRVDSLLRAESLMGNAVLIERASEFQMPAELKDLTKYEDTDAELYC